MKTTMIMILVLCAMLALATSCASLRGIAVNISEEEIANTETAREVARNYLSIWPLQSGFVRGALGPRLDELPVQVIDAMDELDLLAQQYAEDPNDYLDQDLGLSLGLRVRLLSSIVAEALRFYMPDALEFVPFLL